MADPLVSILIPCYNSEAHLSETLRSALSQTWPHCEVIVVDDGSTDGSVAAARSFEKEGVRVLEQKNAGAGAARNYALRESSGAYIQYLDADDLLAPDKIETQMRRLAGSQKCLASARWGRFYGGERRAYFADEATCRDFSPTEFLALLYKNNTMMPIHAWLTPRQIADAIEGWNESLAKDMDGEYFARAVLASEGVLFVERAECYYRSGLGASVSQGHSRRKAESLWFSVDSTCQALLERENSKVTREACVARYQRFHADSEIEFPDLASRAEEKLRDLGGEPIGFAGGRLFRRLKPFLGARRAARVDRGLRFLPFRRHPHRTAEAMKRYRPMKGES